ncbi:MAG TPA: hypothetical protein VJ820_14185 [Propionibacteriaceae bacterium]|nr:hypothetical protein [Propionibacteriaceae bacterium]
MVCAPQRGYGAASHAGLLAAVASVVAVMDADASLNPQQLDRVVAPHHQRYGRSRRRQPSPSQCRSLPMALRLANRELARRAGRRTGLMFADLGPMRAAPRESLLALQVKDRRSGYPAETLVRAFDAGWRIAEVGVDHLQRLGRSKVTGSPWAPGVPYET